MAISIKRYVDIGSGIKNLKTATEKDLIARIYSANTKLPVGAIVEFDSLTEVDKFFGVSSDEYKVAQRYFNFISKYQTKPKKISYAKDFRLGVNAFILAQETAVLSDLQAITTGSFVITVNGTATTILNINLSSCSTLSEVATAIDTAISAEGCEFTLTEDNKFKITKKGTSANGDKVEVSITDLTNALKLTENYNAIVSEGAIASSSIGDILNKSYIVNNNFATFAFVSTISTDDITDIAKWNMDNHPTEFLFVAQVSSSNYTTIYNNIKNINGVSLELCDSNDGKYNFVIPMAITATTDYDRENGTQNYMYQQMNDVKVMVDDDTNADNYDSKLVNYYGRTQQAGQKIAFYQRGVCQGDYQDQSIYVNEIWLKDALTTKFINYMILTPNWYANRGGQSIGNGLAQEVIDRAKLNGTILAGKKMTEDDKVYIYNLTNDKDAWRQVEQEGFYFVSSITTETTHNQTTRKYNYTLIYSKGDSIKKVEGKDILV